MELKDKVVVITGGTKGFGRALAELFIKEGSQVVICSHNKTEVESVGKEIGAIGVYADVIKEEDMTSLAEETIKNYGRIDIWVNNAGIWMEGPAEDVDMNEIKRMFDTNAIGSINGSRVALRHMKKNNSGVILNVISKVGLMTRPGLSMYVATKWALTGFTKTIREENADKNILILGVYPGGIKTSLYDGKELPATYKDYMDPNDVAIKVIANLRKEKPELDLLILRENP